MPQPLIPCLWFDHHAEAAARCYVDTFPGGRIVALSHYPESFDAPGGQPRGSVLTVEFEIAGQRFTALNGGPMFTPNPSISFFVFLDSTAEVDRLHGALAPGGSELMALGRYPWSERYAWVQDRFGISWQLIAGHRPDTGATIVPCLLFAGRQQGRALEAMRWYAEALPDGVVESATLYQAGEGPEGSVKHGRFRIAGNASIATDSHVSPDLDFTPALSFQLMCRDQAEVDRCWEVLAADGATGPCGWLTDRFGVSWQVVPDEIVEWMASADTAARDRAFAAMLQMGKLDIAALRAAFTAHTP